MTFSPTLAAFEELDRAVQMLVAERDALYAERNALDADRRRIATVLLTFSRSEISISTLQPVLNLASELNPQVPR